MNSNGSREIGVDAQKLKRMHTDNKECTSTAMDTQRQQWIHRDNNGYTGTTIETQGHQ